MIKLISTRLVAISLSLLLVILLMFVLELFDILNPEKLWVKMFCLIPSILFYKFLRSLKKK